VTNVYISADSSANTAKIKSTLEALLPDATVSSQADLAQNLSGSLSSASSLVNSLSKWLSVIVLLVAFLIAILFTSSGVNRRIREFGTLKAIGWKTNRIVRQILGESLVASSIGAAIGIIIGVVGIFIVNAVAPTLSASIAAPGRFGGRGFQPPAGGFPGGGNFQPPAGGFGGRGTGFGRIAENATTLKLHIDLNFSTLLIAILIAMAGGLLAGAYGSWRASKLSPAVALRSIA
jgi:ABC-type antimicrobial peptide transport system permease subunit